MAEATAAPIFVRNCRFRVRLWGDVLLIRFELTDVSSLYSESVQTYLFQGPPLDKLDWADVGGISILVLLRLHSAYLCAKMGSV